MLVAPTKLLFDNGSQYVCKINVAQDIYEMLKRKRRENVIDKTHCTSLHQETLVKIGYCIDPVETLDALIDIIVVTIGAIHSMGADAEGAWKEVMRTNFAKIDKETGKVRKREDGKVLKPVGWKAPELAQFIKGE